MNYSDHRQFTMTIDVLLHIKTGINNLFFRDVISCIHTICLFTIMHIAMDGTMGVSSKKEYKAFAKLKMHANKTRVPF